jgi:hypothetical protein
MDGKHKENPGSHLSCPLIPLGFVIDLFEERAVLLSRIGQHDQALDIYVYKLKNYSMAEE